MNTHQYVYHMIYLIQMNISIMIKNAIVSKMSTVIFLSHGRKEGISTMGSMCEQVHDGNTDGISMTKKMPCKNQQNQTITGLILKDHEEAVINAVIKMIDNAVFNSTPECLMNEYKNIEEEAALKEISNNYLKEGMRE